MKALIILILTVLTILFLLRQARKREIEAFKAADMVEFHTFAQNIKARDSEPDSLMARAEAFAAANPDLVTLKSVQSAGGDDVDPLRAPDPSLYVAKPRIFDDVTRNMLQQLHQVVPDDAIVLTRVRLCDFVTSEQGDVFRLTNTHVAYLVCRRVSLEVVCGIQHRDTGGTGQRDIDFVKSVFNDLGIPLIEFPVKNDISETEVRDRVASLFHSRHACPKCGQGMTIRKAVRGKNSGNVFWVCSRFPGCRGVLRA